MPTVCLALVDRVAITLECPQIAQSPHAVQLSFAHVAARELKFLERWLCGDLQVESHQFARVILVNKGEGGIDMTKFMRRENLVRVGAQEIAQGRKGMNFGELMRA